MNFKIIIFFLLVNCLHTTVKSQICSGSLGDAVVNVNFGSGPNPGPSLPGASTSYFFVGNDCPNDGSYTVTNSTANCFSNSWHSLSEDHTPGDINGYMMLVNASIDPGDFYLDTVKGLCSGTTYEFSAWVVNVLKNSSCTPNPIHPKLVFNIETTGGQILGTYSTGDIFESGAPEWKQYGLFFKTPPGTNNVVIRLTNSAPGGCGNDLALDDITFRPCGPNLSVTVSNSTVNNVDLCVNTVAPVSMDATVGTGYIAPSLQWQESLDNAATWQDIAGAVTNNIVISKTAIGQYKYRLTAAESGNIGISNCRVASNVVTVAIHDLPDVTISTNSPVCENGNLQLSAVGGSTYSWTGPAGFTSILASPSFAPSLNAAGVYSVVAKDIYGCINPASATVVITPAPVITTSEDQNFCTGNSTRLSATGGITYLWSPSEGLSDITVADPVAKPAQTTSYQVLVTDAVNCTTTGSVKLTVFQKPVVSAGEDKIIIKGSTVVLNGTVAGDSINYFWTPINYLDNPLLLQPSSKALEDITYILHGESAKGCGVATDTVFIRVFNGVYIPSAFSPNNDGSNDKWRIEALAAYPEAVVTIYSRYGDIVYRGIGSGAVWDGNFKNGAAAQGAYVYVIDLKNKQKPLKGTLLLIR